MTFKQTLDYIKKNRKGSAFNFNTDDNLIRDLYFHLNHNTVFVVTFDSSIEGVITFTVDAERRVLHICNLLCTTQRAFRLLREIAKKHYINYKLTGNRGSKGLVTYDISKLRV